MHCEEHLPVAYEYVQFYSASHFYELLAFVKRFVLMVVNKVSHFIVTLLHTLNLRSTQPTTQY